MLAPMVVVEYDHFPRTRLCLDGQDVTQAAACAGSFLIELLHMRTARFCPVSVSGPEDFFQACQGKLSCLQKQHLQMHHLLWHMRLV